MANPANYEGYLAANGPTDEQRRKRIATLKGAAPLPTLPPGGFAGIAAQKIQQVTDPVASSIYNKGVLPAAGGAIADVAGVAKRVLMGPDSQPVITPAVKPTASIPSNLAMPVVKPGYPEYLQKNLAPAPVAPMAPLKAGEYRATYPTGERVGGNAEDFGKTVYGQKVAAWSQAGIDAAKADPARAVAFKGDRRPVDTRDAKVYDANQAAARAASEAALGRASQEKLSENAMKGEIGKREAAAAGEVAGINAKGEWDVAAAQAKYAAMAPERKADAIDKYSKALANAEPGSQLHEVITRELTALGASPDEQATGGALDVSKMDNNQKKAAIKNANKGKSDAELTVLYKKYGIA